MCCCIGDRINLNLVNQAAPKPSRLRGYRSVRLIPGYVKTADPQVESSTPLPYRCERSQSLLSGGGALEATEVTLRITCDVLAHRAVYQVFNIKDLGSILRDESE